MGCSLYVSVVSKLVRVCIFEVTPETMRFKKYTHIFLFTLSFIAYDAHSQQYGEGFELKEIIPVEDLSGSEGQLTISSTVQSTCAMKGCWMKIDDGEGGAIRVTFKDYGFFVPTTGMEGKSAVMIGKLSRNTLSVEQLRHYAKDAGKSEEDVASITAPEEELTFVATGVLFK